MEPSTNNFQYPPQKSNDKNIIILVVVIVAFFLILGGIFSFGAFFYLKESRDERKIEDGFKELEDKINDQKDKPQNQNNKETQVFEPELFPGFKITYNKSWVIKETFNPIKELQFDGLNGKVSVTDLNTIQDYTISLTKGDTILTYNFKALGASKNVVFGYEGWDFCSNTIEFEKINTINSAFEYRVKTKTGFRYMSGTTNYKEDRDNGQLGASCIIIDRYLDNLNYQNCPQTTDKQVYKYCAVDDFDMINSSKTVTLLENNEDPADSILYALTIKINGQDTKYLTETDEIIRKTVWGDSTYIKNRAEKE